MSRELEVIKRIKQSLVDDGVVNTPIYESSSEPDLSSYFEFMIEVKLNGLTPTTQEVWEHQKRIINRLTSQALSASIEYDKLHRKFRNLKRDYENLIKEK